MKLDESAIRQITIELAGGDPGQFVRSDYGYLHADCSHFDELTSR